MKFYRRYSLENMFALLLVIATISSIALTAFEYQIALEIRYFSIIALILFVLLETIVTFLYGKFSNSIFSFSAAFLLFVGYGLILAVNYGGIKYFLGEPILFAFLTISFIAGILLFRLLNFYDGCKSLFINGAPLLTTYFIVSICVVFLSNGLSFTPFPKVIFEDFGGHGKHSYSQGFTSFFSMAGIYFLVISNACRYKFIWVFLSLICFLFSLLGGARGDFIAGMIVMVMVLIRKPSVSKTIVIVTVIFALVYYMIQMGYWSELQLVKRFAVIAEGDFGMRNTLLKQSLSLLVDNTNCMILGCGYNYFQYNYGYEYGMYPHNIVAESLITFGLLLTAPFVCFAVLGAYVLYTRVADNPYFYMALMQVLISLKSGSLISFFSFPVLLIFAWHGTKFISLKVDLDPLKAIANPRYE